MPDTSLALPPSVLEAPIDIYGNPVPTQYQMSKSLHMAVFAPYNPESDQYALGWANLDPTLRAKISRQWVESEIAKALKQRAPADPLAVRTPVKRYTTDYAIHWGRKQIRSDHSGSPWSLIDREHYDYRTRRHRDLEGAVDALFDTGEDGRAGIQGAGRYERNAHFARFEAWGGVEKARRRHLRVIYLEFNRGHLEPVYREDWA